MRIYPLSTESGEIAQRERAVFFFSARRRKISVLAAAICVCAVIATGAGAEDTLSGARASLRSISALTTEEISKQFGPPDKREAKDSREQWFYGTSVIFFTNGKVSAWSDAGELEERHLLASLAPAPKSKTENEALQPPGWKNAWQREDRVTSDQVIDELIVDDEAK